VKPRGYGQGRLHDIVTALTVFPERPIAASPEHEIFTCQPYDWQVFFAFSGGHPKVANYPPYVYHLYPLKEKIKKK